MMMNPAVLLLGWHTGWVNVDLGWDWVECESDEV